MAGEWRRHPKLLGKFLPDFPDDLQILVHDGGPRLSTKFAEAVWVTVTGTDGEVFRGRVLNQPTQLGAVRHGSDIRFVAAAGADYPVMVTDKYLAERGAWKITPCQKCGFDELFDAPSDLIRVIFPNLSADGQPAAFTTYCPLCGGVQLVAALGFAPPAAKKPWWRFWP